VFRFDDAETTLANGQRHVSASQSTAILIAVQLAEENITGKLEKTMYIVREVCSVIVAVVVVVPTRRLSSTRSEAGTGRARAEPRGTTYRRRSKRRTHRTRTCRSDCPGSRGTTCRRHRKRCTDPGLDRCTRHTNRVVTSR
jgi:hypothetical protein